MSYKFVSVSIDDNVTTVTIMRPEARNALHSEACWEMAEIFDRFEADRDQWVAILTGDGDKAFSAGADLKVEAFDLPPSRFAGIGSRFTCTKPIIAAVNGFAYGGGFEAVLACDIAIAADHARFGLTEPKIGLAAFGGGIQRLLNELGRKRAMALLLTARNISAAEALDLGLINEVVPHADLMNTARRWADEIKTCSPMSIRATKAMAAAAEGVTVQRALDEMLGLPDVQALLSSEDSKEGPQAFFEKRAPNWTNG